MHSLAKELCISSLLHVSSSLDILNKSESSSTRGTGEQFHFSSDEPVIAAESECAEHEINKLQDVKELGEWT